MEMREAFLIFDANQNERISSDKLQYMMNALGDGPAEAVLLGLLDEIDTDGSGDITFDEFVTIFNGNQSKLAEYIRAQVP